MLKHVTSFLGDDVLMYASDYPHSECQFSGFDLEYSWNGAVSTRHRQQAVFGKTPIGFSGDRSDARSKPCLPGLAEGDTVAGIDVDRAEEGHESQRHDPRPFRRGTTQPCHASHDRLCPSHQRLPVSQASGSAIRIGPGGRPTCSINSSSSAFSPPSPNASNWAFRCCKFHCGTPSNWRIALPSVQALSGNRLRLGVGSGSTRADFELLGYDYDHRFGAMKRSLETMRKAWRGEAVNAGGTLSLWPECEGGPPILMGAWRSPRWITFAAKECAGWTPSGRYSSWGRFGTRHENLSRGRRC